MPATRRPRGIRRRILTTRKCSATVRVVTTMCKPPASPPTISRPAKSVTSAIRQSAGSPRASITRASRAAAQPATAPDKSFANIHPTEPPPNHIPVASIACESCHARTNFTTFSGTAMNHAVVSAMACSSCHDAGMSWFGVTMVDRPTAAQDPNHPTTGDCSGCHGTTSFSSGVTKPANHIPTTQACTLCHSNPKNYAIYTMNHAGITSGCATCHGKGLSFANIVPKEPPANHIPTAAACETCHSKTAFTAFSGTAMNHTGITSNCASCHETGMSWFGVTMVDRPTAAQDPNHPKTGDCSGCHTSTTSFSAPVTKPANHIPTTQACALCHTNPATTPSTR